MAGQSGVNIHKIQPEGLNNKVSNKGACFYLPLNYVKFKRKFDINILHVVTNIVLMEYLRFRISD